MSSKKCSELEFCHYQVLYFLSLFSRSFFILGGVQWKTDWNINSKATSIAL